MINILKLTERDTHQKDYALYSTWNYVKMRCILMIGRLYMEEINILIDISWNDNRNFSNLSDFEKMYFISNIVNILNL